MRIFKDGVFQAGEIPKIDEEAVDGLSGIQNSLAYRVHEIESHLHGEEHWYGSDGDGSGSTANNLTEYQCTAGTGGAFGTEAQILAANDVSNSDFSFTPVYFDLHRILISAASANDKNYIVQFWGGTTTFAEAAFLTEVPYRKGATVSEVIPMPVRMNRVTVGYKIWARIKCETNGAILDFLIGIHAYSG